MLRWAFQATALRTWDRRTFSAFWKQTLGAVLVGFIASRIPGGSRFEDALVGLVAFALAFVLTELVRYLANFVRLWRTTPGLFRTIRVLLKREGYARGWHFVVDEERWRRGPHGWSLAVHMSAWNQTDAAAMVPDFEIRSGAMTSEPEILRLTGALGQGLPSWPLSEVAVGGQVDAWMLCSLSLRFLGGRPGYVIVAHELGDWRGLTRVVEEHPRGRHVEEAPLIVQELSTLRYWGEQTADRVRAGLPAYGELTQGDVGRQLLDEAETRDYQRWAQRTVDYLRDRLGAEYHLQFEATPESGLRLLERIEPKTRLLDEWIREFKSVARER